MTERKGVKRELSQSPGAVRMRRMRRKQQMGHLKAVNSPPADWQPDREVTRRAPPFGPGNQAHLLHGASPKSPQGLADLQALADFLADQMARVPGNEYLLEARNAYALGRWAFCAARRVKYELWLAAQMSVEAAVTEVTVIEEELSGMPGMAVADLGRGVARKYSLAKHVLSSHRAMLDVEAAEAKWAAQIGITPAARAKLGKAVQAANADLALVWAAEDEKDTG